jgi:protein PhnA
MPNQMKPCPKCNSPYGYSLTDDIYACPECYFEWNPNAKQEVAEDELKILDGNGNALNDGDAVIVIKDLPVKGASKPVKAGTKVKNIRLTDGDHNINCKIDGFGAMGLKSEFVRKV